VHPARWSTVKAPPTPSIYQRFIESIRTGENDQPDFARGAAIQTVLDACFVSSLEDRSLAIAS
jgi:predicted dehydrogenase